MRLGAKLALMAMFGAVLALLSGAALAESPAPRCFKVRAQGGTIQQICESAGFVTIESRGRDMSSDEAPSPAAARAHALRRFADTGGLDATRLAPQDAAPIKWSGLRAGGGPWGALTHPDDKGGVGLLGRVSYDVAADGPMPLVLGAVIQESALSGGCGIGAAPRAGGSCAVTSLDLRLGYVVRDRIMPYALLGLASQTRHFSPLSGGSEIGAGIAYALDEHWSLNVDYRHIALAAWGKGVPATAPGLPPRRAAVDGFDATLNYRFL